MKILQALSRRHWLLLISVLISSGFAALWALNSRSMDHISVSDHFDGEVFFNPAIDINKTLTEFLRWQLNREHRGEWQWRDNPPVALPPVRLAAGIRVQYINHATALIQIDGVNIVTDPIFSERASPAAMVGPQRWHAPALAIEQLPAIDVVLLSHAHYDHFDLPSLQRLQAHSSPLFIAGLGSEDLFAAVGITNFRTLDWWQQLPATGVDIVFAPAQHWSNRSPADRNKRLWGSFVLRGQSGQVYFAGDTGWGEHFSEIRRRYGDSDIALLPIGAHLPRWFMADQHIGPLEALAAHRALGARQSMAIHFGTFDLSDSGQTTAADSLGELTGEQQGDLPGYFRVPAVGAVLWKNETSQLLGSPVDSSVSEAHDRSL